MSYFRVATVLEIRQIMEKSEKMKRVKIVGEKSKNLREREKVGEKLGKSDKLSETKSSTTPQVQLDDLSFCQN